MLEVVAAAEGGEKGGIKAIAGARGIDGANREPRR
jgi:hypothetical protein